MQSKIQMQFDHMYSKINQIEQDIANQLLAQQNKFRSSLKGYNMIQLQ